jgi:hypothetical protein
MGVAFERAGFVVVWGQTKSEPRRRPAHERQIIARPNGNLLKAHPGTPVLITLCPPLPSSVQILFASFCPPRNPTHEL